MASTLVVRAGISPLSLGDRKKDGRRQHAEPGMVPTHQRLHPDQAPPWELDLGLVVDGQLVGPDRRTQVGHPLRGRPAVPGSPPAPEMTGGLLLPRMANERDIAVTPGEGLPEWSLLLTAGGGPSDRPCLHSPLALRAQPPGRPLAWLRPGWSVAGTRSGCSHSSGGRPERTSRRRGNRSARRCSRRAAVAEWSEPRAHPPARHEHFVRMKAATARHRTATFPDPPLTAPVMVTRDLCTSRPKPSDTVVRTGRVRGTSDRPRLTAAATAATRARYSVGF